MLAACGGGGAEDIGLVFLDAPVDIAPAEIAGAGYLAALDLKKATFTAVGYGLDGFVTGSVLSNHLLALDRAVACVDFRPAVCRGRRWFHGGSSCSGNPRWPLHASRD
jgi:hypothetical protein